MGKSEPIPLLTQHGPTKSDKAVPKRPENHAPGIRRGPTASAPTTPTSSKKAPALQRFWLRSASNIAGPIVLVLCFAFISYHYIQRPPVNGVAPSYWIDPRLVFYGWFLISVFSLNWANSGIAGTEAAAFMHPLLAPKSVLQALWHADRLWGTVGGWSRAIFITLNDGFERSHKKGGKRRVNRNPALLWWYLCIDSLLFFVAIPLSGLAMDMGDAVRPSEQKAILTGTNATTLDTIEPFDLSIHVGTRWLGGRPTAYASSALVYAPEGFQNVSGTYFDDQIREFGNRTDTVRAFFGPTTKQGLWGKSAWGIQSNMSCRQANPYHDLTLIDVTSSTNYTSFDLPDVGTYIDADSSAQRQLFTGSRMPRSTVLTAIRDCTNADFCYSNKVLDCAWNFGECDQEAGQTTDIAPAPQVFELVIWQEEPNLGPDAAWLAMKELPFVVSEAGNENSTERLGYAIHCDIITGTGFVDLDPRYRTWSNFRPAGADITGGLGVNEAPPIHILAKVALEPFDTWYALNSATNGEPYPVNSDERQYAVITPERMQLAVYKILGQAAIETMSREFPPWEGELKTMRPTKVITPGKVPWQFIFGLLIAWALIAAIPTIPALFTPRWASTLDGFEFFKLGIETGGGESDDKFMGKDFWNCDELAGRPARWWRDEGD